MSKKLGLVVFWVFIGLAAIYTEVLGFMYGEAGWFLIAIPIITVVGGSVFTFLWVKRFQNRG